MATALRINPRKRFVVPYSQLHPEVMRHVNGVLGARSERIKERTKAWSGRRSEHETSLAERATIGAGVTGFMFSPALTHGAKGAIALGALAGGAAGLSAAHQYKMHSGEVRARTEALGRALQKVRHVDAANQHEVAKLGESHPFGFVDRRGNLVFVPRNTLEKGLAKAQQTFLKHVTPGRHRFAVRS